MLLLIVAFTNFLLQELGAYSCMDWDGNQSASEVHRRRFGSCLPHSWYEGIYTQWWVQERRASFGRRCCNGRCSSLSEPRKARGN